MCQSDDDAAAAAAQDTRAHMAELFKWKRSEGPEKSVLKNKTPVKLPVHPKNVHASDYSADEMLVAAGVSEITHWFTQRSTTYRLKGSGE